MSIEPATIHRNFESRVQDLIYNVDAGMSNRIIKVLLYIAMVIALMVMYWVSEFWGLKDAEAMDQAQIARQLMEQGTFTTKHIRPAALWKFEQQGADVRTLMLSQPDIVHPPVYPWLLSRAFGLVKHAFEPGQRMRAYPPEQWAIVPIGHLATVLTGLLIFLIARRFFEPRIAVLAPTLFFVTDRVWATSLSGTSLALATMLATLSVYLTLITADRAAGQAPLRRWVVPLVLAALTSALTLLTRYSAGWVILVAALTLVLLIPKQGWKHAALLLALVLLFVAPWLIRNVQLSGSPFGLTPYLALNVDLPSYPLSFERQIKPITAGAGEMLTQKWFGNLARFYKTALPSSGDGLLVALFVCTFFFRFTRPHVNSLRFGLLAAMVGLWLVGSLFGESSISTFGMFWPFIVLYGLSFFYLLLDRMQLAVPIARSALIGVLIFLTALPMIFTLMPPRAGPPYPPYYPSYISMVTSMMNEDELMATDMPWATAWYGNRSSLLVPATIEEFYRVNDIQKRVSGLYFTTLTRDLPYVRSLVSGPFSSWYPIFREMIPMDFPLTEAFFISGRDQIFLTDRPRWPQK